MFKRRKKLRQNNINNAFDKEEFLSLLKEREIIIDMLRRY